MAEDIVICNWCGKEADPEYDDCFALSCSANCHAPKESDLYHDKCLKSYLRGMPGKNYDPSRKSGFPCPRGYGPKAATAVCKGKILHMGKAMVKAVKAAPPPPQPVKAPPQLKAAKAAKATKQAPQQLAAPPKPKPVLQQQQLQPVSSLRSIASVGSSSSLVSYSSAPAGSAAAAVESKLDPLGRNAAAAAAASAKAAKKNAKRAAAKQAKKDQGTTAADGATAGAGSSSSSAALGNVEGLGAAEPIGYVAGGSDRLAATYATSDDEDEIDKWMRKQFAATPMPKPYAAEVDEAEGDEVGSSGSSSGNSSVVEFVKQQQQQQHKVSVHQPPLVLPAAVHIALPVAVPVSAEAASCDSGLTPNSMQPPLTLPQQLAADEDATDEELLALLLSS